MLRIISVVGVIVSVLISDIFTLSPCPTVFKYVRDRQSWHGIILVEPPYQSELKLVVKMDIPGELPKSYIGGIEIIGERSTVVQNVKYGRPNRYKVNFPTLDLPTIVSIEFDGKEICSGPKIEEQFYSSVFLKHIINTRVKFEPDEDISRIPTSPLQTTLPPRIPEDVSPENDQNESLEKCGIIKKSLPLIVGGLRTAKGEWPWLAAIFIKRQDAIRYMCGGTIITKEIILTVAHCVSIGRDPIIVTAEEVVVRLGGHNLQNWADINSQSYYVETILVHPSHDFLSNQNDIAILKLKERIVYSDYILPACLWKEESVDPYYGTWGTIVAWSYNNDGRLGNRPMKIQHKIVTSDECVRSNPVIARFISTSTYCAGNINGTEGLCKGSSGAGMLLNIDGRWTLRGIVSTALVGGNLECDITSFVIYTDVAAMTKWIRSYL